jgi:hypothetical protein
MELEREGGRREEEKREGGKVGRHGKREGRRVRRRDGQNIVMGTIDIERPGEDDMAGNDEEMTEFENKMT